MISAIVRKAVWLLPVGQIIGIINGEMCKLKAEILDGCGRKLISMCLLVYILSFASPKLVATSGQDVAQFIHWVGTDPSAP